MPMLNMVVILFYQNKCVFSRMFTIYCLLGLLILLDHDLHVSLLTLKYYGPSLVCIISVKGANCRILYLIYLIYII